MWQEWLQQKPRVANSRAEENWSSVPEQYKMLKYVKAALPLIITLILDRGYSVSVVLQGLFRCSWHGPTVCMQWTEATVVCENLGWLFHKQLEIVVNRPFFRVGSCGNQVGTAVEQILSNTFLLLWAQHVMETSLSPTSRAAFLSIHFMGWSNNFVFLFC